LVLGNILQNILEIMINFILTFHSFFQKEKLIFWMVFFDFAKILLRIFINSGFKINNVNITIDKIKEYDRILSNLEIIQLNFQILG